MKKNVCYFLFLLLFSSCAGIKVLNQESLYSKKFLNQLESSRLVFKTGDKQLAISKLNSIPDASLKVDELAKKYNLIGVFLFSKEDIEQAVEKFLVAKRSVDKDMYLYNQIHLNLGSSFYRLNNYDYSAESIKDIETKYFSKAEEEKFFKLKFALAELNRNPKEIVASVLNLSREINSLDAINIYEKRDILKDNFFLLSETERIKIIEKYSKKSPYSTLYLARIEATNRFYSGDRENALEFLSWMRNEFSHLDGVNEFADSFQEKVESYSKIIPTNIGVVLPLSGKAKRFGKMALNGISTFLKGHDSEFKLVVKDNHQNSYYAKDQIRELIQVNNVSVIIGGLFPDLAIEEYLEAKKYGVLYISLSPVNIPRNKKNHLLLELPGSIESQVRTLIDEKLLNELGRNVGILYPENETGNSYLRSIWSNSEEGKISLTAISSYKKGGKEYLLPVKKMLGLNFRRERHEELLLWKDIYSQSKRHVRIVNYLKPVVDFDWIFAPSYPHEAIQIIPTFHYYDVKKVHFVGGPSWHSKRLLKERKSLSKMMFVGDDPQDFAQRLKKIFYRVNKKSPGLIETLGYEGMNLVSLLIANREINNRSDLENVLLKEKKIKGVTSEWNLTGGMWLKNLDILEISRKGIHKWQPIEKAL